MSLGSFLVARRVSSETPGAKKTAVVSAATKEVGTRERLLNDLLSSRRLQCLQGCSSGPKLGYFMPVISLISLIRSELALIATNLIAFIDDLSPENYVNLLVSL